MSSPTGQDPLPLSIGELTGNPASLSKDRLLPRYRLSAQGRQEVEDERLNLLEAIFDPLSRQRRDLVQPGWRCLEVGAGRGSMAKWLAQQVGDQGRVLATDVDTTYLERLTIPNLEIRRHDILNDPLGELGPGSFDLVCARLLLFWLAGKQEHAIRRMVDCLRPGGWLLDEDGDWGMVAPVDPSHSHYDPYHRAWKNGEWWAARGYDPAFGRKLPFLFERCGLANIRHETSASVVRGGSPWGQWWRQSLEGIRASEQKDGTLTEERAEEYQTLIPSFSDSSFWFHTALIHGCRGQRITS
ncbi:MAG: methyltransferase domain-containing protein [Nitrospira sp.]|nr:methyltransferase domain-containing protein [Nitrospira sp.]